MHLDPSLRKVASALYCHLNTPFALGSEILLRAGEWDQLASRRADPRNYLEGPWGAEAYRRDAQAGDFLRKSPLLPTTIDRKTSALETFHVCERQCLETNRFLGLLRYPSTAESAMEGRLRSILNGAQRIARRILGPLPSSLDGAFGPGTSFELKGQPYTTVVDKLWITPHATNGCMALFEHMYWNTHWGRSRLVTGLPLPSKARGNRFTTVPKDATKDRGICIEPLGNLWVQLGIGRHLKRRLANVGLKVGKTSPSDCPIQRLRSRPVQDGQTFHRDTARDGSLHGKWATIDLSNASDTVSFELVRWVLPPDWFELLCAARSPMTLIEGQWHHLEKFSSMGNGFTFELETLVFSVVLAAGLGLTVGADLFVYGDDILLPSEKGRDAIAILQSIGMTPNVGKTFLSGPFRESCGGDFFSGLPVRSYFADGKFESPLEWISAHNILRQKWPGANLVHRRCIEQVPSRLRVFGPEWLGDRVFHGRPKRVWYEDGCAWLATVSAKPERLRLDRWTDELTMSAILLGVSSTGVIPRSARLDYRITRASVS